MLKRINILFICFFLFAFNEQVKAEDKIVFVDLTYLYNNSNAGKKVSNELKNKRDKINKDFKSFGKKIEDEKKTLFAQKNVIAEDEYKKKFIQLEKKVQEYNSIISKKRNDLAESNNNVRIDFAKQLRPILEQYSKENSITMIIKKENLLIGKNTIDVKKDLLELFNKKVKNISTK